MSRNAFDIDGSDRYAGIQMRKRRGRAIMVATVIVLIVIFTMLMILKIMRSNKPGLRFMFLSEESINDAYETEALIFRDEVVFEAPVDGLWRPKYPDGTRLAKGEQIGMILPPNSEELVKNVQKTETDIYNRLYELIRNNQDGAAHVIYEDVENEVRGLVGLIYSQLIKRDFQALSSDEFTLKVLLEQRNERLKNFNFNDEVLINMKAANEQAEDALSSRATMVQSRQAGILLRSVDNMAHSLYTDKAQEITADELNDYLQKAETGKIPEIKEAVKNKPLFSMTNSIYQCFVCLLPSGLANNVQVNTKVDAISQDDGLELKRCNVIRSEETKQGTLLVLQCDTFLERFVDRRIINLELHLNEHRGLRVPLSALLNFQKGNDKANVYVVKGGFVQNVEVNIEHYNQDYALISSADDQTYPIEASTMIVLNPELAEEGEEVSGIPNNS